MTEIPPAPDPGTPPPKMAMPRLDTRAPGPPVIRLRRGMVVGLVMLGAALVGGSLAWAFVVQPQLRAHGQGAHRSAPVEVSGEVRPSERVTAAPASYARLDQLPPPRGLSSRGSEPKEGRPADAPRKPASASRPRGAGLTEQARSSGIFFTAAATAPGVTKTSTGSPTDGSGQGDAASVYDPHRLLAPLSPFELKAGTMIPAALLSAVDTARAGPVVAAITENVFDTVTGQHLLVPQGARLIGRHEGESRYGDKRVVIVWERLMLPNGKSLLLTGEPGVDAEGAVGVPGHVDLRLGALATATLFSGAITAVGQAARDQHDHSGGLLGDAGDAAAIDAAQVGSQLVSRELGVKPVIHLSPGERVRVLITRDLVLERYQP